jgi:hypothetical protein
MWQQRDSGATFYASSIMNTVLAESESGLSAFHFVTNHLVITL